MSDSKKVADVLHSLQEKIKGAAQEESSNEISSYFASLPVSGGGYTRHAPTHNRILLDHINSYPSLSSALGKKVYCTGVVTSWNLSLDPNTGVAHLRLEIDVDY